MTYYNYNGVLFEENTPVAGVNSRALRYGDGLFETIKYSEGELLLEHEHFARLWKGMKKMYFDIPKHFTPDKLKEEISKTLQKISIPVPGYVWPFYGAMAECLIPKAMYRNI